MLCMSNHVKFYPFIEFLIFWGNELDLKTEKQTVDIVG